MGKAYTEDDMKKVILAVTVVWERIKEIAKSVSDVIDIWIERKKELGKKKQTWVLQKDIEMQSQTKGMLKNGGFVYHNRI